MVKIACQAIVYGNPVIHDEIDRIFASMAQIGYDGAEVGIRHFDLDRVEYYRDLLEENHLLLPAVHMGGDFLDRDSVQNQLDNFEKTLRFAQKLGCSYIYLSGAHQKEKSVEDYKAEAKIYNDMGKRCRDAGLKLCYHNHDWEIVNQLSGINILIGETQKDNFFLVPDVGWMTVANCDPVAFIKNNMQRVEALHFKDFQPIRRFTELGTGMVDFKGVYDLYIQTHQDFWISAEQDRSYKEDPAQSAQENFKYIDGLRKAGS